MAALLSNLRYETTFMQNADRIRQLA